MFKSKIFNTVNAIPQEYWGHLNCSNTIYYTPEFLNAFEHANKDMVFNYIFILKHDKAIAFATTHIVQIGVESITNNISMSHHIKRIINRMFYKNQIRVLFCGNTFLSGEYGVYLMHGIPKLKTFKAIANAVEQLKTKNRLHAIYIKDFKDESLYITDHLKAFDYTAMHVEPNMIIYLKPEWDNFEDYTKALKSKYRVKVNRANAKSKVLNTLVFSKENIRKYKNELQALYQNTIDNADFNAKVLNLDTYILLKNTFKDQFIVQGYFLNNELVGFLSAMINGKNIDAHFIGFNYAKNKAYAIYPRILNDYIRLGLKTKSTQINLGRTASEIKSTLGATPKALTCYCKHKSYIANQLLKPFITNVQIKSFKQHHPFK